MMKKMFILTTSMLFSANLFCDIEITNLTGDPVIVFVEGIVKSIPVGGNEVFKVEVKEGKSLDGIEFCNKKTMFKWVVLVNGLNPRVYRSRNTFHGNGRSFRLHPDPEEGIYSFAYTPTRFDYRDWPEEFSRKIKYGMPKFVRVKAEEITDFYSPQIKVIKDKITELKNQSLNNKMIESEIEPLCRELVKTDLTTITPQKTISDSEKPLEIKM